MDNGIPSNLSDPMQLRFQLSDDEVQTYCSGVAQRFKARRTTGLDVPVAAVQVQSVNFSPQSWMAPFSHWAILADSWIYHLCFRVDRVTRRPIGLYFRAETAEGVEYMVSDSVGKTQYNVQDLKDIGQLLISYFGSYHLVFWNCQHFANAYLSIICDGQYRPVLTTSDVLRGTMFCTMVGAPLATTHKLAEDTRRTKLVGYVEDDLRQSDDLISELLPSGPVYRSPANCIVL